MEFADLDLVKKLRNKTLETIIKKFGEPLGSLEKMKLSIWDVKEVIYDEAKKIAEDVCKKKLENW